MRIRLETASGENVSTFDIPPFQTPPDVIVWADRTFTLANRTQRLGEPTYIYGEAFAYYLCPTDEKVA